MSFSEQVELEKKQAKEAAIIRRVGIFKVGADGELKNETLEKVSFHFRGSEVFMVTSAVNSEGGPIVAFDSADDLYRALLKWCRKSEQGQHMWREDGRRNPK